MKKINILLFIIFSINIKLFAITYEIKQDSTGDFTTIQAGVEAASDGDTILVYPGTYYENVDYLEKSITIGSLNMTTGDSTYIDSTVIDGNQNGSCAFMKNVDNGIIFGLTLINGSGSIINTFPNKGGGICIVDSWLNIINCIIQHNNSRSGGGIFLKNSHSFISGTIIRFNHSELHGNILLCYDSKIYFDNINLCSVYLNYGSQGNDFWINGFDSLNIILDKYTVSEPNEEFICMVQGEEYQFSCQQAVIEPVEADLYVSTDGDNNNSGLTAQDPLQTMAYALIKIQADSLHPHTIHVADGVYSTSTTEEMLPLNMRSYVGLVGESEENTIIDGEYENTMMTAMDIEQGLVIKNFTMENISSLNTACIYFGSDIIDSELCGVTAVLENITIRNIYPAGEENSIYGIRIFFADTLIAKNITLKDNTCNAPFSIHGENFYGENIKITGTEHYNNFNKGGGILFANQLYGSFPIETPSKVIGLELSDNEHFTSEWPVTGVLRVISNKVIISNATIGDNSCPVSYGAAIMILGGELYLINSIIYDNSPAPIRLEEDVVFGPAYLTVENSLVNGGTSNIIQIGECYLNWGTGNLNTGADPEWMGTGEYPYQLSYNSPCIDSGTTDLPFGMQLPEYDLARNPRIYGETVDMGAYEWQGYAIDEEPINKSIRLTSAPNPFRYETVISFQLAQTGIVNLTIYNIKGQLIRTLIDAYSSPGEFHVNWKGIDLHDYPVSNGAYFVKLIVDDKEKAVRKLVLIK